MGGTALPQRQPWPAGGSSGRTGPARCWPLHSVRGRVLRLARPLMPTLSPALAPARDRQKPVRGPTLTPGGELLGQAPSWLKLSLDAGPSDPAQTPSLHGLPSQVGIATCSHSALVPRAQSGQCLESGLSPAHLCVCVYACDATSPPVPCQGPRIHTACAHMLGLGHGPQSSCLRWALCKHFCACWVGVYLRGLASSLGD